MRRNNNSGQMPPASFNRDELERQYRQQQALFDYSKKGKLANGFINKIGFNQACHYAHDIFRPSCPLKIFA